MSRVQQAVVYLMIAATTVALLIGFWPVTANVFGDPSYSCGSGYIHDFKQWVKDSKLMVDERIGADDTAQGTPRKLCPDQILDNRDLSLLIIGFTVVIGVIALALLQAPQSRSNQAITASMRLRRSSR